MRDPPLATYAEMTGYRPHVEGEPLQAIVSFNALADMHEAMDVEDELIRRNTPEPPKKGGR